MEQTYMKEKPILPLLLSMALPMVLSMMVNSLYNIIDSYFVAKINENAMTALSLVFPVQNLITAVGVGFGIGINATIAYFLGAQKQEKADTSATLGVACSFLHGVLLTIGTIAIMPTFLSMFTKDQEVLSMGITYSRITFGFSIIISLGIAYEKIFQSVGRMKTTMFCMMSGCILNIILDPIMIFGLLGFPKMGVTGAALATSLGYIVGAGMILGYLGRRRNVVRLCRVKTSRKSMRLTLRNVGYMCRLGLSTFLCEGAIAMMMFAGNYVFIRYLGEDGVAAFSVACYFFPIIFMVYNAIGQSAQPILSYNFGAGNGARVRKAFRLALLTAVAAGLGFFGLTALFSRWIVAMFIDSSCPACAIAVRGLPLFASGFVFFAVNIVSIGYFQSVERPRPAMAVTVLRGFAFMAACFFGLPLLLGVEGIWLAVPLAEALTFAVVAAIYGRTRLKSAF